MKRKDVVNLLYWGIYPIGAIVLLIMGHIDQNIFALLMCAQFPIILLILGIILVDKIDKAAE